MRSSKEFYNGVIIFLGIAIYFLLMEALQLSNVFFLRLFNIVFIYYGVNRTLKSNLLEGRTNLADNAISSLITSLTGVFLSIMGLVAYIYAKGGDSYINTLSESLLFVGSPSVMTYNISLLFEGIVSAVIVTFSLMLFWKKKYPTD